jgi:hypothetical protein
VDCVTLISTTTRGCALLSNALRRYWLRYSINVLESEMDRDRKLLDHLRRQLVVDEMQTNALRHELCKLERAN